MTGAALQIDVWTPLRPDAAGQPVQHGVLQAVAHLTQ